jgi:hypothetical protein
MFALVEVGEREVTAALGPIERGLLSHWKNYTRLTIYREVGVWEKREIYTTKTLRKHTTCNT